MIFLQNYLTTLFSVGDSRISGLKAMYATLAKTIIATIITNVIAVNPLLHFIFNSINKLVFIDNF